MAVVQWKTEGLVFVSTQREGEAVVFAACAYLLDIRTCLTEGETITLTNFRPTRKSTMC